MLAAYKGERPKVFLANLGPLAAFTSRASFARNFFEAGGIAAVTNDGFAPSSPPTAEAKTDLTALVAACKDAGAGLVCLCGSDETYGREAVAAANALTAAGAPPLYYAGRPAADATAALAAAGIATFIHADCDALAGAASRARANRVAPAAAKAV